MKDKSITIHGISEELNRKIQEKSRALHLSQNKTVKKVLEDSLLHKNAVEKRKKEFRKFLGVWSKEELKEFENLTKDDETIDPEDWK